MWISVWCKFLYMQVTTDLQQSARNVSFCLSQLNLMQSLTDSRADQLSVIDFLSPSWCTKVALKVATDYEWLQSWSPSQPFQRQHDRTLIAHGHIRFVCAVVHPFKWQFLKMLNWEMTKTCNCINAHKKILKNTTRAYWPSASNSPTGCGVKGPTMV